MQSTTALEVTILKPVVHRKQKSQLRELVETIVSAVLIAAFIMIFIARAYTVNGDSMLPTLHHGERLLVDKISYRFIEPSRGEIIVFKNPSNPSEQFVKRVIGLPGDKVAISQGVVYINDQPIEEDYILAPPRIGFAPQIVPEGTYFVLGDNRNNSEDSRFSRVGFLPKELIIGRAIWRYWPLSKISLMPRPAVFTTTDF
ncbi:MAG: signal peptidase I [Firmicutes bacterium]|nr:signal peptidase I [Bacillota bacterium]